MRTRTEINAERDRQAIHRILHILDGAVQLIEAEYRANRSQGRLNDAALGIRTQTRLEQLAGAVRDGLFDQLDDATEAFVDVADAERYAQRDEYVNSAGAEAKQSAEHDPRSCTECVDQYEAEQREDAEQAAREVEHVEGATPRSVRQIERETAIEAGDDDEDGEL